MPSAGSFLIYELSFLITFVPFLNLSAALATTFFSDPLFRAPSAAICAGLSEARLKLPDADPPSEFLEFPAWSWRVAAVPNLVILRFVVDVFLATVLDTVPILLYPFSQMALYSSIFRHFL